MEDLADWRRLLIRNAGLSGKDITIYEADERIGGGFFLRGSAKSGYNLPGSVFDKEYRCTFELLKSIPSASNPSISVTEEFFAFNTDEPYHDKAHIFDRDGHVAHSPRFGLTLGDGFSLARVLLMPEAILDERCTAVTRSWCRAERAPARLLSKLPVVPFARPCECDLIA